MIHFKRKYSTNIGRNAGNFSIFILLFVITTAGLTNWLLPEFTIQPFNEAYFGKFFSWGHVFMILVLIFLTLLGVFLARKNIITYPIKNLTKQEIQEFNQKYGASFPMPNYKGKYFFLILLTTIFPVLIPILNHTLLTNPPEYVDALGYSIGFFLMTFFFYKIVKKMLQKSQSEMTEIFKHINQHLPQTQIKLNESNLKNSNFQTKVSFSLDIEGTFRGRDFSVKYKVSGTQNYRSMLATSKGGINLKTKAKLPSLIIEEHKNLKNKFSGKNLNECFEERFKIKGIQTSELSDKLKTSLLESPRTIFLELKNGILNQEIANIYILPFYSAQGMILFLDFMHHLLQELEK